MHADVSMNDLQADSAAELFKGKWPLQRLNISTHKRIIGTGQEWTSCPAAVENS